MLRLFPLLVALIFVACSKDTPAAANLEQEPGQAEAAPAAAEPVKPVPAELPAVLARINGEEVSKADFEKALLAIERRAGASVPPDQRDEIYRGVLDQLITYRVLLQETKTRNVTVTDADVDARIAAIRSQFPTEEAFTQTLQQQGVTLAEVRTDTRNDMLVSKMIEASVGGQPPAVSPETVTAFYAENPDQFLEAEKVRASHILIGVPQGADAAAKEAARTRAAGVLRDAKAGRDFGDLARQHSEDPGSAPQGGDLGFFTREQMVGPFAEAAFTLPAGQTSELVETEFGFHIIRVAEKQAARTVPFEDVREQIREYLENQSRQKATQDFVESLRSRATVDILM